MTKELATVSTANLVNWNDEKMQIQIRKTYGKDLDDMEWGLFLNLGKATGLNPALREIWAVKYGTNPASIFIGRDGYRRSAQNHPEYEYHQVDALYANDTFSFDGKINHTFSLKDRGALVGAYCIVKRKSASVPMMNYVELKEYTQTFGVWKTKPATMIKKVAEAQGLRGAFQELFAGTYEESENWRDESTEPKRAEAVVVNAPKPEVIDAAPVEQAKPLTYPPEPKDLICSKEQQAEIKELWEQFLEVYRDKSGDPVPEEKKDATLYKTMQEHCGVDTTTKLRKKQASSFIKHISDQMKKYEPIEADAVTGEVIEEKITPFQTTKLHAVWGDYVKAAAVPKDEEKVRRQALMIDMFGVDTSKDLTKNQASELIARIEADIQEASL